MKKDKQITFESWTNPDTIEAAQMLSAKGKNDKPSVRRFSENRREMSKQLSKSLKDGTYKSMPYKPEKINDNGKERDLLKSVHRDHVVRRAFMLRIEKVLYESFIRHTYAALPLRGSQQAAGHVFFALNHYPDSTKYCLKLDVRKYFDSIDREILKHMMSKRFADKRTIEFSNTLIDEPPGKKKGKGIPIGNYPSQWFANLYLSEFDHWITEEQRFKHYYRYMDDIVVLAADKDQLRRLMREIAWYFKSKLQLTIKDNWQIFPVASRGIDFVGYRIFPNYVILRKKTFNRLRHRCLQLRKIAYERELTNNEKSSLFAYLGRVKFCTPKARKTIYDNYFYDTIQLGHLKLKPKMKKAFS